MNKVNQQIAIAKVCGVVPRRMWRVWFDKERQHGSICISTKEDALARSANEKERAERLGFLDYLSISEPEEYDEWKDAPDYLNDLNAMHDAEKILTPDQRRQWIQEVQRFFPNGMSHWESSHLTAPQRAEAFLRTLNIWENE